jgi:hypothetical protein
MVPPVRGGLIVSDQPIECGDRQRIRRQGLAPLADAGPAALRVRRKRWGVRQLR